MAHIITKASGEQQQFDIKKFKRSLTRAGATEQMIERLAQSIVKDESLKTTRDIYRFAMNALKKDSPPTAARYNLKEAIYQLGPAGFPFEKYVSEIFKAQGFTTSLNKHLAGKCVTHEIDFIAKEDGEHSMVECKFHNSQGIKTSVKVTLYIKARFDDLKARWEKEEKKPEVHHVWIVTNTKFTSEAIAYGECENMRLLSWNYPAHDNLPELIDSLCVHPITCLTSLTAREKKFLIQHDLCLCNDIDKYEHLFEQLKLSKKKIEQIREEAEAICAP